MLRFATLPLLCVLLFASWAHGGEEPEQWRKFVEVVEAANDGVPETLVMTYEVRGGVMKVARDIVINEDRTMRTIQLVRVRDLAPEVTLEGMGGMADPWVKLRTRNGARDVDIRSHSLLGGRIDEETETSGRMDFIIIHCRPDRVRQVREAAQEFIRWVQRQE